MRKFEIFTDSIANLSEDMIRETGIHVIPYFVTVDGHEISGYEAGRDMEAVAREFYGVLRRGSVPNTSLISSESILAAVRPFVDDGTDALIVTCSSGISGTHAQALKATEEMNGAGPGRGRALVCDSANAGLGEGLLAVRAARLRDMGHGLDDVAEWLGEARWKMNSVFTADDLSYLRRSGRVSAPLAALGTVLNIKPVLYADGDGRISLLARSHGRKKAIERLAEETSIRSDGLGEQTVAVTHCDCAEDAERLADALRGMGASDVVVRMYDICSGSHLGPGGLAVFFSGKDRRVKKTPVSGKAETNAMKAYMLGRG